MSQKNKNTQFQYQGYVNTPFLWLDSFSIMEIEQMELIDTKISVFDKKLPNNLLLGKRVERFISHQIQQFDSIEVLCENVQIQNGKLTVGELDAIIKANDTPIHLEMVYKFYLHDETVGETELNHWIGPNRKDSLIEKLNKLKNKQFPLLYNEHTKPILEEYGLEPQTIQQKVLFKAQLFKPYQKEITFNQLNSDCLAGFYIKHQELEYFTKCKFFIPKKVDWLIEPYTQIDWSSFDDFSKAISEYMNTQRAPLCWIKHPNGTLQKFFVVWW